MPGVRRLFASGKEGGARLIGLPFDQDGGCVAQTALLVLDDRVIEPAHCRQALQAEISASSVRLPLRA